MEHKLKYKLKEVPQAPGVYLMKDSKGAILYVGKAKNLKSRLRSYFATPLDSLNPKTKKLVSIVEDFDLIFVSNEGEALLLERTLIKDHEPKYNVIFRDDKAFPYIRVDLHAQWPRFHIVRRRKKDKAIYVGPYSKTSQLKNLLHIMYEVFPLIRCSEHEFANATRPCNYYAMKKCLGPCTLDVKNDFYKDIVKEALDFLKGKDLQKIKTTITQKMKQASKEERYEDALLFRNQLEALKGIKEKQHVLTPTITDADVFHMALEENYICFHALMIRESELVHSQSFSSEILVETVEDLFPSFLLQFYEKRDIPSEIILPSILKSNTLENIISSYTNKKIKITFPKIGERKKSLALARINAVHALQNSKKKFEAIAHDLENLKEFLKISRYPRRIECFDISHFQGSATVASRSVFIDGQPTKKFYRRYNLEELSGKPDDFQCMKHVIAKRFKRMSEENELPDLIVIDGGKGQLSAALEARNEYPLLDVPLIALAKKKTISQARSSSLQFTEERVFLSPNGKALELNPDSSSYRILTQIRDEAHRFGVSYHRLKSKIS